MDETKVHLDIRLVMQQLNIPYERYLGWAISGEGSSPATTDAEADKLPSSKSGK